MVTEKYHAPLGSSRNRYAPRLDSLEATALAEVQAWFEEHPQSYVAISGGKDSTVCLDLARRVNPGVRAVFFDSGLEFPQTRVYLKRLSEAWQVPLTVYPAQPSALEVMVASGTWESVVLHVPKDDLHAACITRPLARAQQELGRASIYGLRADESVSRKMLLSKTKGRVTKHSRTGEVEQQYLAPIWRWSFEEVYAYCGKRQITMNPLYKAMQRLGVPARRARVGMLVDGWALDQGRWAIARALAPDLARQVEAQMPALAEFR